MGRNQNTSAGRMEALKRAFFEPVDIASLVFFRMAFGLILFYEIISYFRKGWIDYHFIVPRYNFKYYFFQWVEPLSPMGMYILFAFIGLLTLCIAAGFMYRPACLLFFVCFGYTFLIEKTQYLNHLYLIIIISFLLAFIPANRAFSLDAKIWPKLRSDTAPAWALWLIRGQIAIVYIWGGIHKTNPDWLRGQPMGFFLSAAKDDVPAFLAPYLETTWVVLAFAYGGLLLDLFVVPFLLWKPTRIPAFLAALSFHVMNAQIFNISIFPWFMICATLIFFDPSWPRKVMAFVRKGKKLRGPDIGKERKAFRAGGIAMTARRRVIATCFTLWFVVQMLIPIRPYFQDEFWLWADFSNRFSWNMMLVEKHVGVHYVVRDPKSGQSWTVDPRDLITEFQYKIAFQSADMVHELAKHIAQKTREAGYGDVEVYARTLVSLNGRKPQPLVDPNVDLASKPLTYGHMPWLEPLQERYPPKEPWSGPLTAVNAEK